jgi:hypothetical protein
LSAAFYEYLYYASILMIGVIPVAIDLYRFARSRRWLRTQAMITRSFFEVIGDVDARMIDVRYECLGQQYTATLNASAVQTHACREGSSIYLLVNPGKPERCYIDVFTRG